jgi:phosphatidate cytidylyltransferase
MLRTRVITAVIALAAIAVVLLFVPPRYTEFVIGLLLLGAAWEWSGFLPRKDAPDTPETALRIAYTVLIGVCLAAVHTANDAQIVLLLQVAAVWWFLALLWTLRFPTPIPAVVRWLCGILVIVPLFAALFTLLRLGLEYFLFVLLIVWVADGGAYFAGKYLGRVKLAPAISPGKTWEGVIGGLALVAVLAIAAAVLRELPIAVLLPFCLGVAAISVVGDLTVSMFKRTAGVKDSGTLFPGHGGILDRIDSIAAAAPVFALGITWLGLA